MARPDPVERLTESELNRLSAEVDGDPMMLAELAEAWLEAEDEMLAGDG